MAIRTFSASITGELKPANTILPPFVTPSTGGIARFMRDEELALFDYKSRVVQMNYKNGALPATVKLDGKPDFMPMSKEWQELHFKCLQWQAAGTMTHEQLLDAWKSATLDGRALNDQHSRDNGYRDWILGVNLNSQDMEQRGLSMAGNIVEILWGSTFKTLDLSQPPPPIEDIWGNHTLIWWATETNRPLWYDGGRNDTLGRWPQLGKLGVPFLNVSYGGTNHVDSTRIEMIKNNIPFSPYHL